MKELLGKDLAGWRLETWYELRLCTDERGAYGIGGYFTEKDLAIASGRGKAWHGSDGTVIEVLVLTNDSVSGFLIGKEMVILSDEKSAKETVIERAKSKLSPEERKLLGIE